jgi:hypothetical protein
VQVSLLDDYSYLTTSLWSCREIDYEELVLVRPIGEGSFGKVRLQVMPCPALCSVSCCRRYVFSVITPLSVLSSLSRLCSCTKCYETLLLLKVYLAKLHETLVAAKLLLSLQVGGLLGQGLVSEGVHPRRGRI